MNGDDVRACLLAAVNWLDELGVSHCLVGALALGFYGGGRATQDVDLLVAADAGTLDRLRATAANRGFSVDAVWEQHYPDIRSLHARLVRAGIPIDLMLPRDDHDRSAMERRREQAMGDRKIWVLAPEDLILQKLKVGRPRDFDDVIPFFARQRSELDHEYLNQWARRLGVREEFDFLWSQSGSGE